jgi:hypothetical protein
MPHPEELDGVPRQTRCRRRARPVRAAILFTKEAAMIRSLTFLCALAAGIFTAGCGTIYSAQDYGTPATQRVSEGASRTDVFANLGQPNAIYNMGESEVFFYKHTRGKNILGLYSKIVRDDMVVILNEDGLVTYAGMVPVGTGTTILSPPMLDATHPVRTDTLLFDPENYDIETSVEP